MSRGLSTKHQVVAYIATFVSMLTGASVMHVFLAPDLTIPDFKSAESDSSEELGDRQQKEDQKKHVDVLP